MPSSSSLALAGRLRTLDDGSLIELVHTRQVREFGIKDFFDLADRLLARDSIQASLVHLDRPSLLAIATGVGVTPTLAALALTDEDDAPYQEVTSTLQGWPALGLPSITQLADPPPAALAPVSATDPRFTDHSAAEQAFATTTAALEIVSELRRAPARELVRGGIALPDAKRLAAAAGVALDELPPLVAVCAAAELATLVGSEWQPGAAATAWRAGTTVERWLALAASWFAGLPSDIRSLLGNRSHAMWGEHLADYVRWLYPASADRVHERMAAQLRCAGLLGILADGAPSSPGTALLEGAAESAAAAMAALFPTQVTKAYLQHDLTIVSPGPLEGPLDSRLRELADVESAGLATTYRVSAGSLNRAISAGETAESLREFLRGISLTGIPQPLEYLIVETTRRHGLVRVGRAERGSYVRSVDENLLAAIAVDQALSVLGLRRSGAALTDGLDSRFDVDLVFWALTDARYPAAAEDSTGEMITLDRRNPPVRQEPTPDTTSALIATLRLADTEDTAAGWMERLLDAAVKARTAVAATVNLPGGQAELILEPTGIGGGRLRARDRASDTERTLPLSSILEVRPVD